MSKIHKQSLLLGAIILAFGGVVAKIVGAIYKIPLTNILGSNGIGIYYLVFPIYSLLLVISSSGISIAVTKMVSAFRRDNHYGDERRILIVGVVLSIIISSILSIIIVVCSNTFAVLQGNVNASIGYLGIAPAIIFASVIAVLRGYFQGVQNMIPTTISNILEQLVKLLFGLLFASSFKSMGMDMAVFGAVMGVTVSELLTLFIMIINYKVYVKKISVVASIGVGQTYIDIAKEMLKTSLPMTLSSIILPLIAFIDSFVIINILKHTFSSDIATAMYGISNGVVGSLIGFPTMLVVSLATALVPSISSAIDADQIRTKTSFVIKIVWCISLPCAVVFVVYCRDIISILFGNTVSSTSYDEFGFASNLLMISSINIIYMSYLYIFNSILYALGQQNKPVIAMLPACIIRTIIMLVLTSIPSINIFGVAIANTVFGIVATSIELRYVKKYLEINYNVRKMFWVPVFATIGMVLVMIVSKICIDIDSIVTLGISLALSGITYLALLYIGKVFNEKERRLLPRISKTRKIIKIE